MDESEVDAFADEYRAMHAANIKLSGEAPEFFAEYKIRCHPGYPLGALVNQSKGERR